MNELEEIYKQYSDNLIQWMKDNNCVTTKEISIKLMQKALEYSIPIILKEVSEKAEVIFEENNKYCIDEWIVDKQSILSLEQELIEKYAK